MTSIAVICALVLTLALPIFPQGIEPSILAFFGLAAVGGTTGLLHRAARHELIALVPWILALFLAMAVGSVRSGDSKQALEDSLPYLVFMLGLIAGRGLRSPRAVLVVVLVVCAADSAISLWSMPRIEVGIRSTYTYYKIIGGLPLVGMFASTLLRQTDGTGRPPRLLARPMHAGIYAIMWVAMIASVSRGMMLGWLLGMIVMAYMRRPSRTLALGLFVLIVLVLYASTAADVGARYLRTDSLATVEGRYREISAALSAFAQHPLLGSGLGDELRVDGSHRAYVHNMAVYHLWKFGLIGTTLMLAPFFLIGRQVWRSPIDLRSTFIGGAAGITSYLVTCATFKNYYVVWIYGVAIGATLSWLAHVRIRSDAAATALPSPTGALERA